MSKADISSYVPQKPLTKGELLDLESTPKTPWQRFFDSLICLLPVLTGGVALLEYYCIPDLEGNEKTNIYAYFILIFMAAFVISYVIALFKKSFFATLRYKAPFYAMVLLLLAIYDYLTLKTGILLLPYFPWADQVLNAFFSDTDYLIDCTINTSILLGLGYSAGVISGLITGIACGYNDKINYWVSPFLRLFGAIPSTTWIPVVMVIATTLFGGSIFIIALGVWFSVSIASITGIQNIDTAYFQAARTLGAKRLQLVFRVAIPFALPSIFQGMVQGMSTACMVLTVAEMIGVESGLGWYILWQKSWAQFGKMYAAIVLLCILFVFVNWALNRIRKHVLRWQVGITGSKV